MVGDTVSFANNSYSALGQWWSEPNLMANTIGVQYTTVAPILFNDILDTTAQNLIGLPTTGGTGGGAGAISPTVTKTSYRVIDSDKWIVFNTTGSCTLTLPKATKYPGREIFIKQIAAYTVVSASSNVQPLTSVTAGTAILSGAGKFARLISNGTHWVIMESN